MPRSPLTPVFTISSLGEIIGVGAFLIGLAVLMGNRRQGKLVREMERQFLATVAERCPGLIQEIPKTFGIVARLGQPNKSPGAEYHPALKNPEDLLKNKEVVNALIDFYVLEGVHQAMKVSPPTPQELTDPPYLHDAPKILVGTIQETLAEIARTRDPYRESVLAHEVEKRFLGYLRKSARRIGTPPLLKEKFPALDNKALLQLLEQEVRQRGIVETQKKYQALIAAYDKAQAAYDAIPGDKPFQIAQVIEMALSQNDKEQRVLQDWIEALNGAQSVYARLG